MIEESSSPAVKAVRVSQSGGSTSVIPLGASPSSISLLPALLLARLPAPLLAPLLALLLALLLAENEEGSIGAVNAAPLTNLPPIEKKDTPPSGETSPCPDMKMKENEQLVTSSLMDVISSRAVVLYDTLGQDSQSLDVDE